MQVLLTLAISFVTNHIFCSASGTWDDADTPQSIVSRETQTSPEVVTRIWKPSMSSLLVNFKYYSTSWERKYLQKHCRNRSPIYPLLTLTNYRNNEEEGKKPKFSGFSSVPSQHGLKNNNTCTHLCKNIVYTEQMDTQCDLV